MEDENAEWKRGSNVSIFLQDLTKGSGFGDLRTDLRVDLGNEGVFMGNKYENYGLCVYRVW